MALKFGFECFNEPPSITVSNEHSYNALGTQHNQRHQICSGPYSASQQSIYPFADCSSLCTLSCCVTGTVWSMSIKRPLLARPPRKKYIDGFSLFVKAMRGEEMQYEARHFISFQRNICERGYVCKTWWRYDASEMYIFHFYKKLSSVMHLKYLLVYFCCGWASL